MGVGVGIVGVGVAFFGVCVVVVDAAAAAAYFLLLLLPSFIYLPLLLLLGPFFIVRCCVLLYGPLRLHTVCLYAFYIALASIIMLPRILTIFCCNLTSPPPRPHFSRPRRGRTIGGHRSSPVRWERQQQQWWRCWWWCQRWRWRRRWQRRVRRLRYVSRGVRTGTPAARVATRRLMSLFDKITEKSAKMAKNRQIWR